MVDIYRIDLRDDPEVAQQYLDVVTQMGVEYRKHRELAEMLLNDLVRMMPALYEYSDLRQVDTAELFGVSRELLSKRQQRFLKGDFR